MSTLAWLVLYSAVISVASAWSIIATTPDKDADDKVEFFKFSGTLFVIILSVCLLAYAIL